MADSTAPAAGPSGSSLYENTSNKLEISTCSSDESLSSNEEESSSSIS